MGWIKLDRKILECDFWRGEPFSRGQAWIDLLLLAAYEERDALSGAQVVTVPRGCVKTSIRDLAKRWDWSTKKVLNFLQLLEGKRMVQRKSNTKETLLTIVNYSKYQDCGNAKETQKKHEGNTFGEKAERKEEQKEKKQKKEENKRESKESIQEVQEVPPYISFANAQDILSPQGDALSKAFRPPSVEDVAGYVAEKGLAHVDPESFVNFYASKGWMVGKNKMKDWRAAARGWNSRHGKTGHELPANGRGATFFDLLLEDETT